MANQLVKPIKKGLSEIYGYKNVSVRNGRGTAWGWVEIEVVTDYEDYHEKIIEIEKQAQDALRKEKLALYSYTDDMGYDYNEVLVNVRKPNKENDYE